MRIKTMLIITIIAALLGAVGVIVVGFVTNRSVYKATQREEIASGLSDAAFGRIAARSDWLVLHNERTADQWRKLHESVGTLLSEAKEEFRGVETQAEIKRLIEEQPVVGDYFSRLEANWVSGQAGALDQVTVLEKQDELLGQMTARVQRLNDFSSKLAGDSHKEAAEASKANVTTSISLVSLVALLVLGGSIATSITVIRGLSGLRKGTDSVTAGNLTYRIDESGKSEMAELAHSFNEMTAKIQGKETLLEGLGVIYRETLASESEVDVALVCLSVAQRLTDSKLGFLGEVNDKGLLDTKVMSETGWDECMIPGSEAIKLINNMEIRSYWGRVIKEGRPQIVNDPASDADSMGTPEGHPPIYSFLGAPLVKGRETVGIIALGNREGGYTGEHVDDLRALGIAYMEAAARRRAEDEVRIHRDHLGELVKERTLELESALIELKRSNAELQQFAYVASHDLQEPLRMIASYLQLLEERYGGRLDSDADEFIEYAVDGAHRMQGLINDLLEYSRLATSEREFHPTDTAEALTTARMNLNSSIEESQAIVTSDPLPTVFGHETQLVQLFQNLLANAIKFRGEGPPRVHVSAVEGRDEWLFSVEDNGIGFDEVHAERIFIIFQRLNPRRAYEGSGMGLAICKSIVERHGGRIWAESSPGEGSTFFFTVPFREGGGA